MTARGRTVALLLSLAAGSPAVVGAQEPAPPIAMADSVYAALDIPGALRLYEASVAADSGSYEALWKAARTAVDLGDETTDKKMRSELYARAAAYARRAVAAKPDDAEGHFHLARSLGVAALSVGIRDRVKYATEVRAEALRAHALDPRHPGALHVLGVWNAEVMRLSGFERTIARTFLGGKVFSSASWADAIRYMEQAVAVDPDRLTHHLDLARIYRDVGEKAKAREQYQAVIAGRGTDYGDPRFKREAQKELGALDERSSGRDLYAELPPTPIDHVLGCPSSPNQASSDAGLSSTGRPIQPLAQVVPCVVRVSAEATCAAADSGASLGAAFRSEQEGGAAAEDRTDRDPEAKHAESHPIDRLDVRPSDRGGDLGLVVVERRVSDPAATGAQASDGG